MPARRATRVPPAVALRNVNAAALNHAVDVRGAYNAEKDPDLSEAVGWVPSLYGVVDPAFMLQAATASGAGPFNW